MSQRSTSTVAVIGGGVVGVAVLHALAHRGVDAVLFEAEHGLAYGASGTNSGVLHTGFDSTPGELETELILRAARLRPAILAALDVPVLACGAVLVPRSDADRLTVLELHHNARRNGVETSVRESDGALHVPGEAVTDPVAFTTALADSATRAGGRIELGARVCALESVDDARVRIGLEDGRVFEADAVVNAAGLHADTVAGLLGDTGFSVYPRKGEFFVFELPAGRLEEIILPVPTKRTKGVLVFPTVDGRVVAGPTAVDLEDKDDWGVRDEARAEVLEKAVAQYPQLRGLAPVAGYAGLRPAGRDVNYLIGPSAACPRLINVAAIRSTGLTAALGIADYVAALLPGLGIEVGAARPSLPGAPVRQDSPWWRRTADLRSTEATA